MPIASEVKARVVEVLRLKRILTPEKELLWMAHGDGLRLALVIPVKGASKMREERSVTVGPLSGSIKDQANGILGAFLAK